MEGTQSPRGTRITPDTSPRTKKEERKSRQSIPKIREKSAKSIPNLKDCVRLTPEQSGAWDRGDLNFGLLTPKQQQQVKDYEKKLPREVTAGADAEKTPRKEPADLKLSSGKGVQSGTRKVLPSSQEHAPSTPKGKSSPRIKTRSRTPGVVIPEQMEILTAELNEPVDERLEQKIHFQREKIGGLKQQLKAEEGRLSLLRQKRDALAAKAKEIGDTSSSTGASALVHKLSYQRRQQ
ncbi:hypothetical protein [Rhizobacter sp. P5_C2]